MAKTSINIQDGFLFQALKAGDQISVQLTTGPTIEGQLKRFDRFAIVLDVGGREQMVYKHGIVLIDGMRRVSKPSRRVYVASDEIPKVRNGLGIGVISTSKGIMTDRSARDASVGGEYLCEVW